MADEAFALSPLSARASLPSEADYDAIRDAFMETTRGRWFLTQYAARNRNADTTLVLAAVARIEADIAARAPATPSPAELIAAISPLIADARSAADAAMMVPETDEKVAAGRRGARIIREISWSLRETGTDPRICNILDQQLLALETLHDHLGTDSRREQIGELFDDLVLRVAEMPNALAESPAAPKAPDPKPEPVESVGANADIAAAAAVVPEPVVTDTIVAEPPDAQPMPAPEPAPSDDIAPEPTAHEMAADDAVLDLIATEMAAPDFDLDDGIDDEFDRDDSAIAELKSLAQTADPLPAAITPPAPEPPPLQPSLGAALIAGGLVRAPRPDNDALAPFRRMSQIEKIAFFS